VGESTLATPSGHVASRDGTRIAFWRSGQGPPLVLVHGATADHTSFRFLAPEIEADFTVCAVDRRGRGESGDTADYAIEREFEDVAAVVGALGGPVDLFGHSFGGTAALGAAPLTPNLRRLVLYEPSPGISVVADEDVERIEALVARGEREEALIAAYRSLGLTPDEIEPIRASPVWPARVAAVHTIAREIRAEEAHRLSRGRFETVTTPTLLLLGEESPDWARAGVERIRAVLPHAEVAVLRGQAHLAILTAPALVAVELSSFLGA